MNRQNVPIGPERARLLPPDVRSDVEEFVEENRVRDPSRGGSPLRLEDMTPKQVLAYYLNWNGIVGYRDTILGIVEVLL